MTLEEMLKREVQRERAKGREEGREEGRIEGEERLNKLYQLLFEQNRLEGLQKDMNAPE